METNIGMWIDHRRAVLVIFNENNIKIKEIKSNVEKQPGRVNGIRHITGYKSHPFYIDDKIKREFMEHLHNYYNDVIRNLQEAESVFIFGPGEAKKELKKHMEKRNVKTYVTGVEPADRMTDRQIVAKVKKHFLKPNLSVSGINYREQLQMIY